MIYKLKFSIAAILILILSGCVNLKNLNIYSEISQHGIKKFYEIGFSFKQICEKNCEIRIISDQLANTAIPSDKYKPIKKESECECKEYVKADSAFNKIYFATLQYLEGINRLSSNDVLTFKYDTLANALKQSEILKVNDEQINAFNMLVNTTSKFIVDIKRRKDLQEIIEYANPNFQILIERLQYGIDVPIKMALETEIDLEYNYYLNFVFHGKDLSLKDKLELEQEFIKKRNKALEKTHLLSEYSRILDRIKKGHQSIYDNRDKIHKQDIAGFIAGYITEIKEIEMSFNNIKTLY